MNDPKFLAHITGELVVISGVAIYFQRKVSGLQSEIEKMKKDNEEMYEQVSKLTYQVSQLIKVVTPQPVSAPVLPIPSVKSKPIFTSDKSITSDELKAHKDTKSLEKSKKLTKEDLDKELEDEYKLIENERKNVSVGGDVVEISTTGVTSFSNENLTTNLTSFADTKCEDGICSLN